MYKLICLDLDGTLFTSNHRLCKRTVEVLRRCEEKGAHIAIVTGRAPFEAQYYAGKISSKAYFLGANGAFVGSPHQLEPLSEVCFSLDQRQALYDLSRAYKVQPALSTRDGIHVVGMLKYWFYKRHSEKEDNTNRKRHIHYLSANRGFKPFLEHSEALHKCVFFITNDKKRRSFEQALRMHPEFETAVTSRYVIEVTPKGVNKAYGVERLVEHLGIGAADVIAFGDSENDLEMLKYVGMGVAMGNGTEHLKAHADMVTLSNDEAGIAITLESVCS